MKKKEKSDLMTIEGNKSSDTVAVEEKVPEGTSTQDILSQGPTPTSPPELTVPPETPPSESPTKKTKALLILVIVLIVAALVFGVFILAKSKTKKTAGKPSGNKNATPTVSTKLSPTPTKKVGLDKSKYKIKILNGSGITGEAGKLKESLEKEKYIVVVTDNADNSDYTDTLIQYKRSVPKEFVNMLSETLKKDFQVKEEEKTLTDNEDIVIIIGSKKAQ